MFKNKKIILIAFIYLIFFGLFIYAAKINTKEEVVSVKENLLSGKAILEINGASYEDNIVGEMSVYDFIEKFQGEGKINFTTQDYFGMGKFVESINGIKGNGDQNWIYYINGKEASVGVSNYKVKSGDIVSWKYEKRIF